MIMLLRLPSAYLACVRIRRAQGFPLERALVSALSGAASLASMRAVAAEFAQRPEGYVKPVRDAPEIEEETWRSPYPVGTVLLASDGRSRRVLLVKGDCPDRREVYCQDTATGSRSTICLG